MATLYRDAATGEYYTSTEVNGEPVTLQVHPDGVEYLELNGVDPDGEIPDDIIATLQGNQWLYARDGGTSLFAGNAGTGNPVTNESETGAAPAGGRDPHVDTLPTERLEPRPWMEQENAERFEKETDPAVAGTGQSTKTFAAAPADRENAQPLAHPEDTAFASGLWFWVLVAAAVLIVAWVLIEVL